MTEQTSLGDFAADDEDGAEEDEDQSDGLDVGGGLGATLAPVPEEELEDEDEDEEKGSPIDFPTGHWERTEDGGVRIVYDGETALVLAPDQLTEDTYIAYTADDGWKILDDDPTEGGPKTGPEMPTWTQLPEESDYAGWIIARAHRNHRRTIRHYSYGSYHDSYKGFRLTPSSSLMVEVVDRTWSIKTAPDAAAVRGDVLDEVVGED